MVSNCWDFVMYLRFNVWHDVLMCRWGSMAILPNNTNQNICSKAMTFGEQRILFLRNKILDYYSSALNKLIEACYWLAFSTKRDTRMVSYVAKKNLLKLYRIFDHVIMENSNCQKYNILDPWVYLWFVLFDIIIFLINYSLCITWQLNNYICINITKQKFCC